jgi:hypothetical protein
VTAAEFAAAGERLRSEGFERVQGGTIRPVPPHPKPSFADRAVGFKLSLLGACRAPDWRSKYENRLLDTDAEWAHWRRPRR